MKGFLGILKIVDEKHPWLSIAIVSLLGSLIFCLYFLISPGSFNNGFLSSQVPHITLFWATAWLLGSIMALKGLLQNKLTSQKTEGSGWALCTGSFLIYGSAIIVGGNLIQGLFTLILIACLSAGLLGRIRYLNFTNKSGRKN